MSLSTDAKTQLHRAAPPMPKSYTPAELMQLAESPLATQFSWTIGAALHEFADIAWRKRSREHIDGSETTVKQSVTAPPRGRRPANLNYNRRNAGLKTITDGSSWRLGAQARQLEVPGPSLMTPMAV
ncbi:hypothetical protein DFH09DRAFT_1274835 [Mycena vulgaris]|nr:hypothetical protein DFH09DRAFT_1274835 [Mycena vulgaris]